MIHPSKPEKFNPKFEAASCLIEHDLQYLLLQRAEHDTFPGTWALPGGGVEENETDHQAVIRETKEETIIELTPENTIKVGEYYVDRPEYDLEFTFHMFSAELNQKDLVEIEAEEHQDYRWVAYEEARKMNLIPDLIDILRIHEQYRETLSKYWNHNYLLATNNGQLYQDLSDIAQEMLRDMPQPTGWVCGPISNGGAGSVEENLKIFRQTIKELNESGKHVFDQMPMEDKLLEIGKYGNEHNNGPKGDLLDGFYRPVFESELVHTLYFIKDWESSDGAKWEHEQAKRLNLNIEYL